MVYKIVFQKRAQDWMDSQTESVRKRALAILNNFAEYPREGGKRLQNPIWLHETYGWGYRIHVDSLAQGMRCIYYVFDPENEMIIVKFGTHDDDVYEDGND